MGRIALVLLWGLSGCADPAVAALEEARALHQAAEVARARGDVAEALRALEAVAKVEFPASAPEAEDVRVDALAEASRVLVSAGRAAEAEAMARRAVGAATRASYFAGLAWLRLGDALRAQGRGLEAVAAYERSIAVNRAVLEAP
jgi:tetratricopeptide (TPR) repeat protein